LISNTLTSISEAIYAIFYLNSSSQGFSFGI